MGTKLISYREDAKDCDVDHEKETQTGECTVHMSKHT